MNKLIKNKFIALLLVIFAFITAIGAGYSLFYFGQTNNKEVKTDNKIEKMDDVKDNYYFHDDTYHVIFFAQPPRDGDNFGFDSNGFTGTYNPGDQSMGYWDEAGGDGTGKNRMFKEITVQRALSPKDLDTLPDLYIDRPDDHGYPLTFTGWTANRQLMADFVKNSESSTGFQGTRDNDYDYIDISQPLSVIDERLPDHTQSTDTTKDSIDGSKIGDHYILLYPIYTTGKAYNGIGGKKFIFRLTSTELHNFNYTYNGTSINKSDSKYQYYFMQDWNTYSEEKAPYFYYYYYNSFKVEKDQKYNLSIDVPQLSNSNWQGDWQSFDWKHDGNYNIPFFAGDDTTTAYINGEGTYNVYAYLTFTHTFSGDNSSHSPTFDAIDNKDHALVKADLFTKSFFVTGYINYKAWLTVKVEKVYDFRLAKAAYSNNFSDISTAPSFAPVTDGLQNNGDTTGTPLYFKDYYLLNVPVRNEGVNQEIKSDNQNENVWYKSNFFGLASIDYPLTGNNELTRFGQLSGSTLVGKINDYDIFNNSSIAFDSNNDFINPMTKADSSADFQSKYNINRFFSTNFSKLANPNDYIETQVHFLLRLTFKPSTTDNTTALTGFYLKAIPQKKKEKVKIYLFSKATFDQNKVTENNLIDLEKTVEKYKEQLSPEYYVSDEITRGQEIAAKSITMTHFDPNTGKEESSNLLQIWREKASFFDHLTGEEFRVTEDNITFDKTVIYLYN